MQNSHLRNHFDTIINTTTIKNYLYSLDDKFMCLDGMKNGEIIRHNSKIGSCIGKLKMFSQSTAKKIITMIFKRFKFFY